MMLNQNHKVEASKQSIRACRCALGITSTPAVQYSWNESVAITNKIITGEEINHKPEIKTRSMIKREVHIQVALHRAPEN